MSPPEPHWLRRLLAEHPALLLTALYIVASTIGMLFYWSFLRRFDVNVFLYAEIGDFLLASLREPFTWVLVLFAVAVVGSDNLLSRWVQSKTTSRRWRWYASPRYRDLNYLVTVILVVVFIETYAASRAEDVADGRGAIVTVRLAGEASATPALLLGTTGRFIFLYDRAEQRVDVHPNENVVTLSIQAKSLEASSAD